MAKWTAYEDEQLRQLKDRGLNNGEVGIELGRSRQAVICRWYYLNLNADDKRAFLDKKAGGRSEVHRAQIGYTPRVEAPDGLIAERNYRVSLPRTITGRLMNDPPPGYSALDRKRAGLQP